MSAERQADTRQRQQQMRQYAKLYAMFHVTTVLLKGADAISRLKLRAAILALILLYR